MKIAIASGKGGTGKTTISTNLAVSLSSERKVVLADMDVEEPDSLVFINANHLHEVTVTRDFPVWVENLCTMCGECQDVCNYNAVISIPSQVIVFPNLCHSCFACSELCPEAALPMRKSRIGVLNHYESGNLTFIEGRLDIGQEQSVPLIKFVDEYVVLQAANGEIVIFDSPPGTSCPMAEVVKRSDFIILVTEPTPFGLNDLKLAVKTVRKLGKPFGVVINRSGIGNDNVEKYCMTEEIRILATIPNSVNIARLYSKGSLLCGMDEDFDNSLKMIKDFINLVS